MATFALAVPNGGAEDGTVGGIVSRVGGLPQNAASGADVPAHSGTRYFVGSANAASCKWDWQIAVDPALYAEIDSGYATAVKASAWHIGFSGDNDSGALYVECIAANGTTISKRTENAQSDPAAWTQEFAYCWVPPGTRFLRIGTNNVRQSGTQLSTYWDDFALEMSDNPTVDYPAAGPAPIPCLRLAKTNLSIASHPPARVAISKTNLAVLSHTVAGITISKVNFAVASHGPGRVLISKTNIAFTSGTIIVRPIIPRRRELVLNDVCGQLPTYNINSVSLNGNPILIDGNTVEF